MAAAVAFALAAGGSSPPPLVIDVPGGPAGLAVSDGRVAVAASRAGEIVVLDAATGEPAGASVRTGGTPVRVAPGTGGLWAADAAAGAVIPVDSRQIYASLQPGADANDLTLAAGALWIASSADGRVYVLAPGSDAIALRADRSPVALAADDRRVVAADARTGTLAVFDARGRRALGAPIPVGGALVDVALAGDTAWAVDAAGGRVVAVDLQSRRVTGSVDVGRRPVAVATAGEDVYVLGADELLRIRGGKVRSRRDAGAEPTALAVDRRYVWVSSAAANEVRRFER